MSEVFIRYLVENRIDHQELRKAAFNRIIAYVKANSERFHDALETEKLESTREIYARVAKKVAQGKISIQQEDKALQDMVWYYNMIFTTEKGLTQRLDQWSENHPLRVHYLSKIHGIGPVLASETIAWLSRIILNEKTNTVSKLWAYCGLSSVHWESKCREGHKMITTSAVSLCPVQVKKKGGKKEEREPCGAKIVDSLFVRSPPKRKAGHVLMINTKLRTFCWKLGAQFERADTKKSQFRRLYLDQKSKYLTRPKLSEPIKTKTPGAKRKVQMMTYRYVVKRFLSHLWYVWRKREGLPVTEPYAVKILGHSGYEEPRTDEEINAKPKDA